MSNIPVGDDPFHTPIGLPQDENFAQCYSPTSAVVQMYGWEIEDDDEIDPIISHFEDYHFYRRVKWTTIGQRYRDQRPETMPQQILKFQEFVITRENWTPDEIFALETFFDNHRGSALPFYFTAPDDGESYAVRFSEDSLEITFTSATLCTCEFTLVEAGDLDNSINNGLVYPDYVEPIAPVIISGASTDGGTTVEGFIPDAIVGAAYAVQFIAANGTEPYTWECPAGSLPLPPGLIIAADTGILGGVPLAVGHYEFTIKVTDSATNPIDTTPRPASALRDFQMDVLEA